MSWGLPNLELVSKVRMVLGTVSSKYTHQNSTFVRKEGKRDVRKDGRDGGEKERKEQEKKENVNHRLICIGTCVVHT